MEFVNNSVSIVSIISIVIYCIYFTYEGLTSLELEKKMSTSRKLFIQNGSLILIYSIISTVCSVFYVIINEALLHSIVLTMLMLFIIISLAVFITFCLTKFLTIILGLSSEFYVELECGEKWLFVKTTSERKYILKKNNQYKIIDSINSKTIFESKEIQLVGIRKKIYEDWFIYIVTLLFILFILLLILMINTNNIMKQILIYLSMLIGYIIIILSVSKFILKIKK